MCREAKYIVKVMESEKAFKIEKELSEMLRGSVSGKMISRMKKEYVECPLAGERVPFLRCFACISFMRRVRGEVYCSGEKYALKT